METVSPTVPSPTKTTQNLDLAFWPGKATQKDWTPQDFSTQFKAC